MGGGPNPYLVLSDNNPNACWFCHENLANIGGSGSPPGYGRFSFYQGKTNYQSSSHYNSTSFYWPGKIGDPVTIWPRRSRQNMPSDNLGSCLNCHTPHGIKGSATAVFDDSAAATNTYHEGLSATKQAGLSVPYLIPRQLIAFEEALCLTCHDADGPSTKNIKSEIVKLLPASGAGPYGEGGSGHPVFDTNQQGIFNNSTADFGGRHNLANEENPTAGSWNSYANNTRHVECTDCHNPHVAQSGTMSRRSGENATGRDVTVGPVAVGGVNKGVWGVSIDITTGAVTGVKQEATYIYELCLKCHSTFADSTLTSNTPPSILNRTRWDKGQQGVGDPTTHIYMPWAGTLSDVAQDFKTSHDAYHPVFALGKNQPPSTANPRWSNTLNCCGSCTTPTNCNVSGDGLTVTNATLQPAPPEEFRLNVTNYIKKRSTGKRPGAVGLENAFVPPWGPQAYVTCTDCHESETETSPRGPHGSSRPFMLRKLDPDITYTIENDVINQTETGPVTVSYRNFSYGVNGKGTVAGRNPDDYIGTIDLSQWDPNNLCLNCHRADVYGFYRQSVAWSGGTTVGACGDYYPRFRYLSRQPHPPDGGCKGMGSGKGYSFESALERSGAGFPPRGIVCLRCHGGNSPGAIHGNDSFDGPGGTKGRLLYGTVWTDYTPGSTTQKGTCTTGGVSTVYNSCTHNAQGNFDTISTYDY